MFDIDVYCVWIVDCPLQLCFSQATDKGEVVFRHKGNFVKSAAVMVFQAENITDEYVRSVRRAAQKRYADKD